MPAWPGGPCPTCGQEMPEKLIHCFNCRTLLNTDLEPDSVEIPQFVPLQEISSMVDVAPAGFYVTCPHCREELRIASKYEGQRVSCKHCEGQFNLDFERGRVALRAYYGNCPSCQEELRVSPKYLGQHVVCKHCSGHLKIVRG